MCKYVDLFDIHTYSYGTVPWYGTMAGNGIRADIFFQSKYRTVRWNGTTETKKSYLSFTVYGTIGTGTQYFRLSTKRASG